VKQLVARQLGLGIAGQIGDARAVRGSFEVGVGVPHPVSAVEPARVSSARDTLGGSDPFH
jgi:hypothetical protein